MWLVSVVVRRYIDILIIIINFPYSTCIRSFFGSSIPTSLFIFKMFFRSYIHRIAYVDMFPTDSVLYDVDLKILTDYIYICRGVFRGGGHLPTLELFSPPLESPHPPVAALQLRTASPPLFLTYSKFAPLGKNPVYSPPCICSITYKDLFPLSQSFTLWIWISITDHIGSHVETCDIDPTSGLD